MPINAIKIVICLHRHLMSFATPSVLCVALARTGGWGKRECLERDCRASGSRVRAAGDPSWRPLFVGDGDLGIRIPREQCHSRQARALGHGRVMVH